MPVAGEIRETCFGFQHLLKSLAGVFSASKSLAYFVKDDFPKNDSRNTFKIVRNIV